MRFRAAIWVGALLAACALALAACADDAQQQAEQGAAAQPQAAAAAEPQAAAPAQAAQQQEAETAPQSGSTAQSAQQSAEPTEQAAAQQAEPPEEGEPPPADAGAAVQLDAIQALYNRWVANLTSFVLQFDVAIGVSGQPMSEQTITMQVQLEPLAVHYRTQLPAFEGMADDGAQTDAADAQAAGPPTAPVTDFLLIEDSVYISLPEAGGWVRAPLDQNAEAALTDIFGSGGDDLVLHA